MEKTITFIAEDKKRERMKSKEGPSDENVSPQPLKETDNDPEDTAIK